MRAVCRHHVSPRPPNVDEPPCFNAPAAPPGLAQPPRLQRPAPPRGARSPPGGRQPRRRLVSPAAPAAPATAGALSYITPNREETPIVNLTKTHGLSVGVAIVAFALVGVPANADA